MKSIEPQHSLDDGPRQRFSNCEKSVRKQRMPATLAIVPQTKCRDAQMNEKTVACAVYGPACPPSCLPFPLQFRFDAPPAASVFYSPLADGRAPGIVLIMQNEVVEVTVKGAMPMGQGCAVFLGNKDKNFVIHVDSGVGQAISMSLHGVKRDRPLTHDLMCSIFLGLGVQLERIIVNDVNDSIFYARIILRMENEVGKKIVEIDARPSDSIALALQLKRPILVAEHVFEAVEDMTEILDRVLKQQNEEGEET